MLILYSDKTTSFSTLGIGALRDFISDPLITEELNGAYTLEFSYAKSGYLVDSIVEGAIIKANNQPFRIWSVKKDMNKIEVFAKHLFFDLSTNFLEDVAPTKLKSQEALDWILKRAQTETLFKVSGDCSIIASARYVRKNITDAIYNEDNAILKRFGGELELDGYNIIVHSKRGKNANFSIRYKKNLTGIEFNLDFSTVATRIMPQGANELFLEPKYVDSPLIENYFTPIYKKVEFSNIGVDENTTEEEAKELLLKQTQKLFEAGIDKPEISIKIDFVELSKCIEYKDYSNLEFCNLGDTIKAIIPELNINLETRIVKTVYNCSLKRFTNLELGTVKPDFASNQSKVVNEINNAVSQVKPESILNKAIEEATNIINHPFSGNIYIDKNTGVLYLMDTNDILTSKNIWKWSLGGLGFSKNGVNGPYETAITQDGSIVANFITVGQMETGRIKGLNSLIADVSNLKKVTEEINDYGEVNTIEAVSGLLLNLKIKGQMTLLFPPFLANKDALVKDSFLVIENEIGIKKIKLPINYLNYLNDEICDEFINDDQGARIIRRVGIRNDGTLYKLDNYNIERYGNINIFLDQGINKIYLESFRDNNINYYINYARKNEFTDSFTTKVEMNSLLNMTEENIDLKLSKKTDNDKIIASINLSTEKEEGGSSATINADKINLQGKILNLTTDNIIIESNNFNVDNSGKARMKEIEVDGGKIKLYDSLENEMPEFSIESGDGSFYNDSVNQLWSNGMLVSSKFDKNIYIYCYLHRGLPAIMMNDGSDYTSIFSNGITTPQLTQTSTYDKKKNFELLENATDIIINTDIYKYHLKSQKNYEKKKIGVIIGNNYRYSKEITSIDETGNETGINLYSMVSVAFKAIKEQNELLNILKNKINDLEEKINGISKN